jgi:hypothetical protein
VQEYGEGMVEHTPQHLEDTGNTESEERRLSWQARRRLEGLSFDLDNPPPGIEVIQQLPEAVATVLFDSLTANQYPLKRRRR